MTRIRLRGVGGQRHLSAARSSGASRRSEVRPRPVAATERPPRPAAASGATGSDEDPEPRSNPVRTHAGVAVRVLPRSDRDHGRGPCEHTALRVERSTLRGRPRGELRRVRGARPQPRVRPERLRRNGSGRAAVWPCALLDRCPVAVARMRRGVEGSLARRKLALLSRQDGSRTRAPGLRRSSIRHTRARSASQTERSDRGRTADDRSVRVRRSRPACALPRSGSSGPAQPRDRFARSERPSGRRVSRQTPGALHR